MRHFKRNQSVYVPISNILCLVSIIRTRHVDTSSIHPTYPSIFNYWMNDPSVHEEGPNPNPYSKVQHLPITRPLQIHYKSIASLLQVHYRSTTSPLPVEHKSIAGPLQGHCCLLPLPLVVLLTDNWDLHQLMVDIQQRKSRLPSFSELDTTVDGQPMAM